MIKFTSSKSSAGKIGKQITLSATFLAFESSDLQLNKEFLYTVYSVMRG